MTLKRAEPTLRFDREAWLQAAMDILAQEGQAKLQIETLAHKLGVTRGSFYHHFKTREEFVHAILEYWSKTFTEQVNALIEQAKKPARERLLLLMQMIEQEGLDHYDIAFRSWAAQDPAVAKQVRKVDRSRYDFVRSMFAEMGFTGADLEDRVHIFLVFVSAQRTIHVPDGTKADLDTIARRHAFFTRPNPQT